MPQSKKKFLHLWSVLPALAGILIVTLTALSWYQLHKSANTQLRQHFETLTGDTQAALEKRFQLYQQSLRGGVGLYDASNTIERQEWTNYVEALNIRETLPGINGLGFIDYVKKEDLPGYLETVRADGAPGFKNHPDTEFGDKFIIKYIVPVPANNEAIGLDIGFETHRREAAERARDTGNPALTKIIQLVQDNKNQPGFLLLLPVYEKDAPLDTLTGRREHFRGWVYAPFMSSRFFQDLVDIGKNEIDFEVYDGKSLTPENLIYASTDQNGKQRNTSPFKKTTSMELAGRTWTIVWHTTDSFKIAPVQTIGTLVVLVGLVLAVFITLMLRQLVKQRHLVEDEVARRTEELSHTKNQLRMIMDHIPDLIFMKDDQSHIVEANPAFLKLYAPEVRDQVIGKTMLDQHSDEEKEIFLEEDKKALQKDYTETREDIQDHNGRTITLTTRKIGFNGIDGKRYLLGIARDVGQEMEIQEQIRLSEERLNLVVKGGKIGLWDWNAKSGSYYFNEEFYTILGYDPYELPVRFRTWAELTHPEDFALAKQTLTDHLEGKTQQVDILVRMKRKTGEWAWINIQGKVFERDKEGKPKRVAGIQVDVTEIKSKELEAEKAREEAKLASRMKSEFVTNMSHEIRTPMNGILGMARLLMKSGLQGREKNYAQTLINSTEALLNIINDILDFSKIEAGKLELEYLPTDLPSLLQDVSFLHSLKAQETGVELILHIVPGVPRTVNTDPVRVRQILNNLISNAIKFTDKGHILVKAWLAYNKNGPGSRATLHVSVEDTGCGIPPDAQQKIFTKFTQADISTTRKYGGTGLGLSITQQLVEKMGGKITVKSIETVGSAFQFQIPVDVIEAEKSVPGMTGRVLVVDGNDAVLSMMRSYLEQAGLEFAGVDNIRDAGKRIEKDPAYNLVIINRNVPDLDIKAIKKDKLFKKLPKILMVPDYESEALADAEKIFNAVVTKPVFKKDMLLRVMEIIKGENMTEKDRQGLDGHENNQADDKNLKAEGARILLVDDSPVNQLVAEEILKDMGAVVTLASNGQEALEKVRGDAGLQLILMDCRMPVMDGFEATQEIRAMQRAGTVKDIPVIALTAGVSHQEREECTRVGMDDFVAKPVNPLDLQQKVYKWLSGNKKDRMAKPALENPPAGDSDTPLLEPGIFEQQRTILNDKFDYIVGIYLEELDKNMTTLTDSMDRKKWDKDTVARMAHTMKSACRQFGALHLSDLCAVIEKKCDQTNMPNEKLRQEIEPYIISTRKILEQTVPLITARLKNKGNG